MRISGRVSPSFYERRVFNNSSGEESLYEIHIQSMIRRAGPGAIKSHLKLDFLSEYSLKFEERSSVLLAWYWNDVKTGVNNEYPEQADFCSGTNDSSPSGINVRPG